ncbi:hypothetical protein VTH82DRAFT_7273 [Thermothelomyces myriococcoides]
MMEKVRQTIAQSKSEAMDLYDKINTLTRQVEEKDAELGRERESNNQTPSLVFKELRKIHGIMLWANLMVF